MMYLMIRRKPEPTVLPTQGIFNISQHIGMVWEELTFDDTVNIVNNKCIINIISVNPRISTSDQYCLGIRCLDDSTGNATHVRPP